MIYIITGTESYLIDKELNKIINNNKDADICRFDGSSKEFSVQEMIDSCQNIGLFCDKVLVLVNNPYFLIRKASDEVSDAVSSYCNNPVYECDLVFYSYDSTFLKRLSLYKDIVGNCEVHEYNQLNYRDYFSYCFDILKIANLNIDKNATDYLIKSCGNSITVFKKNIDVLELYPEHITKEVVEKLLISNSEEDVFNLINALTNREVSKAIYHTRKYLSSSSNLNGLISLLATQLRFLYEISFYRESNYSIKDIMKTVNTTSSYRIEKAFDSLNHIKRKDIVILLDKLSDLDYILKSNNDIDENLRFELFITNLIKNEKS